MRSRRALCQVWWVAGSREHQSATSFPPAAPRRRAARPPAKTPARRETCAGSSLDDLVGPDQQRLGNRQAECPGGLEVDEDRKSTRLNSSHLVISYAVFCLKKKKQTEKVSVDTDYTSALRANK